MATAFFFWLQNLCVLLVLLRPSKTLLRPYDNIPQLELQNIREPILNFTSHFGEINPDIPYLCRRGQSGLQRAVFAFFPSVRRESMKKNVKSSIFRKKTSKFLSSLPFKTQTIDNQWEYDDASEYYRSSWSVTTVYSWRSLYHHPTLALSTGSLLVLLTTQFVD